MNRKERRLCKKQGHQWKAATVLPAMGSAVWFCGRCGVPRE